MTNSINNIEALLFDLGGVVIEIDFGRVFSAWAARSGMHPDALRKRFRFDEAYERHERGEIDGGQYFEHLRRSLNLDLDDASLASGWNSIYVREIPNVRSLLARLASRIPVYAFTNSNPTHMTAWEREFADVLSLFRTVFVSSSIGRRKPEADAFQAVSDAIGVPLEKMMFFDDTEENVKGAQAAGMTAVQVRSIEDIERATAELLRHR